MGLSTMTIEKVIERAKTYLRNPSNLDFIRRAYEFAEEHHRGQFRKSQDPYIQHPLEVAYMLAELHTSPATIVAGLLHDLVEDTDVTKEQVAELFGIDVANIVDGVTKISKLKYMTQEKALARSHQKILLAMAKDIRVVVVKLVDRVHNMRTLEFQTEDKQKLIAQETLDLYAPLAHRMGMYRIKAELEDLSLKFLRPEKYQEILEHVRHHRKAREEDIKKMENHISVILQENGIENFEIKGRIKNIYSVCKKMEQKRIDFEQIYDLMALRILVPSIENCYHVLGLVHNEWTPIPKRFKDYIATPKPNLYQSLHTTVVGLNGKIYEIQIRTYEMDEIAEYGIAAHWAYKEDNKGYTPEKEQLEVAAKLKWYKDLLTYAELGEQEDNDPLETIKEDIFSANVYVFTPKGDVMDFPNGATPLDFAYRIHTEVGNKTVGAIVNNRIVPLTYKLKTGDVVEIKTSQNFDGPNESWLKIVKTSHARHKITSILNRKRRDQLIAKGKDEFTLLAKNNPKYDQIKLTDEFVKELFSKYGVHNLDDFYFEIGKGNLSAHGAYNRIYEDKVLDEETLIQQINESEKRRRRNINDYGIIIEGLERARIHLAHCCYPIKGDDIVGYVSKGAGIIVHRFECPNVNNIEKERFIDVIWDPDYNEKSFDTNVHIISFDRKNIVAEIINTINSHAVTITAISSSKNRSGDLLTKLKLMVKNVDTLNVVFANLYKIADIYDIERIIK
ncbi:MAG TPA: bifunctional (p)ppGpp synthetase/guanosine-3',5'-bis(diphosphate) 3'-pyrophosphohydrolase [Acholeplasmataceae bacterium]|nr:bifunctional (p)ppGpp synthetase/guanosine-3',5'-bis(diphosphate) 3'-pyrophosphohydrolase [Acholeplasmataceae bacterium]